MHQKALKYFSYKNTIQISDEGKTMPLIWRTPSSQTQPAAASSGFGGNHSPTPGKDSTHTSAAETALMRNLGQSFVKETFKAFF